MLSSSMNGYAAWEANGGDTTFLKLLDYLDKQPDARLQLLSSDYPSPKDYNRTPNPAAAGQLQGDLTWRMPSTLYEEPGRTACVRDG